RRNCWEDIGGFPEIVSEDLAFAVEARKKGWRGYFAEHVICYEEFPQDFRAFRIRHMKWTRGTCQLLACKATRIIFCPILTTVEKIDILLALIRLPFSAVAMAALPAFGY